MLKIVDHPLLRQKLTQLRDERTGCTMFRQLAGDMTMLLTVEATRELETKPVRINTPLAETDGSRLARRIICVPILRAGCGMEEGFRRIVPQAATGLIGLKRNEATLQPDQYYLNLPPNIEEAEVFVVDPMLATGGSLKRALEVLRGKGVSRLTVLTLVASPEGKRLLEMAFPEVPVYTAALDERLNEHGYILPGLGDAGDRIFGTIE